KRYDVYEGKPRERHVATLGAVDAGLDYRAFKGEVEAVVAIFEGLALEDVAAIVPPAANKEAHTWLAEIALDRLYAAGPRRVRYSPPPRFPAAERDFSFLFSD